MGAASAIAAFGVNPQRIRLSRARGWRLPENTVNVARPGSWGNPFVVGEDGTREHCVELYALLAGGYLCLTSKVGLEPQKRAAAMLRTRLHEIRGRDLACWCRLDGLPCHADVLLLLANEGSKCGILDRFVVRVPDFAVAPVVHRNIDQVAT